MAGPEREDFDKDMSFEAPLPVGCKRQLVVQLKRELDLPRIIWGVSSGPDFTEVGTRKVARTGDGYNAVATEIRGVEVWVVENVKEFRTELEVDVFLNRKVL